MIQKCKEDSLRELEFKVSASAFSVIIYRKIYHTEIVPQISDTNKRMVEKIIGKILLFKH